MQIVDALPREWTEVIKVDAGKSRLLCELVPQAIVNAKLYPIINSVLTKFSTFTSRQNSNLRQRKGFSCRNIGRYITME